MMEILYETGSMEIRGWCADPKQFGLFKPKAGQIVVVLPIELKDVPKGEDYLIDLDAETIIPQTPYVAPPDYKAQFKAAKTDSERIAILAKRLNWDE